MNRESLGSGCWTRPEIETEFRIMEFIERHLIRSVIFMSIFLDEFVLGIICNFFSNDPRESFDHFSKSFVVVQLLFEWDLKIDDFEWISTRETPTRLIAHSQIDFEIPIISAGFMGEFILGWNIHSNHFTCKVSLVVWEINIWDGIAFVQCFHTGLVSIQTWRMIELWFYDGMITNWNVVVQVPKYGVHHVIRMVHVEIWFSCYKIIYNSTNEDQSDNNP